MDSGSDLTAALERFTTFGELLRYLRRRARLTQRELGIAVGYTYSHISRLENGLRAPDPATLSALFLPALRLHARDDAPVVVRLTELARQARDPALPAARSADPPGVGAAPGVAAAPRVAAPPGVVDAPGQLPPAVPVFVGREAEWDRLERLLKEATGTSIVTISGSAGIGKTTLAVRWAHQVADRFPDGQLSVNLRGFDPAASPVEPGAAIRGFLDAFAVAPHRIPSTLDGQVGLYRSVLAGRRVLVLLDNAASAEQVRPLLPGAPGCLVVVTSRRQLRSLAAVDGADPITLDLLTRPEARDLLARRLGPDRVGAEPDAADEIITRCARLPLALAVVAARAAAHPRFPLRAFAGELRAAGAPGALLDVLRDDDPAADLRAVFSWSYRHLGADAGRLFRLLGLPPGPDLTATAAASLAGLPVPEVRPLLTELVEASLISEPIPGRYGMHDLLRAYATEQVHAHDAPDERRAATHRLLDHYLHTAHAAGTRLYPTRDPITPTPPRPGAVPQAVADQQEALAWFTAEHPALLAAVDHAAGTGFETHAWQLAWILASYLERRGHWQEWAATGRVAVAAAARLADPPGLARTRRSLGFAYARLDRFDEADSQLGQALRLYRRVGDPTGEAHTHQIMLATRERRGHHREALAHGRQALDLYRSAGHRHGQAQALNNIGWCHALLGEFGAALEFCGQALPLLEDLGNRDGQANTWDSLGFAHHHLGEYPQAVACYRNAVALYRELGDRFYEADTLHHLGDTQHAAGDAGDAEGSWRQALAILDDLDHPDADRVRAKLCHA